MPTDVKAPSLDERVIAGKASSGHSSAAFWPLTLGSIGVVYRDIGTSPLYAVREWVLAAGGGAIRSPLQAAGAT